MISLKKKKKKPKLAELSRQQELEFQLHTVQRRERDNSFYSFSSLIMYIEWLSELDIKETDETALKDTEKWNKTLEKGEIGKT